MSLAHKRLREKQKSEDGPLYLTKEGIKKLEDKLVYLKKNLPHYISEVARTAAYGDRSENAEYVEARKTLNRANAQIFNLEHKLLRVVKIEPGRYATGKVQLGSNVCIEGGDGKRHSFVILGSSETNPAKGFISNASPLGVALLGKSKGEEIKVKSPSGELAFLIISVD